LKIPVSGFLFEAVRNFPIVITVLTNYEFKRVGMRNAIVQLGLVLLGVTSVHAVKLLQTASLRTRVYPSEAAEKVWAINGNDSIQMFGSEGEYYITTLKPGYWEIRVSAKRPYQDLSLGILNMKAGTDRDLGEIILQK
jgi:hypothetical protein